MPPAMRRASKGAQTVAVSARGRRIAAAPAPENPPPPSWSDGGGLAWHLARSSRRSEASKPIRSSCDRNWLRAYDWTTDRGAGALSDSARTNDPFTKVDKQQIAVEVSSVIPTSADSFRAAWTEKRYENGRLASTERWTVIFTIVIQTPRDADRLRANHRL